MIARIWHAWTARADADAYQHLMCGTVIPAFEARGVAGLMQIDILRRDDPGEEGPAETEFTTVMLFDTIEAIQRFAGDDITHPHVPPEARAMLIRCDNRTTHHAVVDRRVQPDNARGRA